MSVEKKYDRIYLLALTAYEAIRRWQENAGDAGEASHPEKEPKGEHA